MTTLTFSDYFDRVQEFILRHSSPATPTEGSSNGGADREFNEMALHLFALQFAFNLPYRNFCQARKVSPAAVSHWTKIPALPASAFKELPITSLPAVERTTAFHSSGTTEQRSSRHFHNAKSLALYESSLLPWFQAHLLGDLPASASGTRMRMISLTPPPAQ